MVLHFTCLFCIYNWNRKFNKNFQAPPVVYHNNASNSCCFSSLASEFTASGENNSARDITILIEESLNCQSKGYRDMIAFANTTMKYQMNNMGEHRLRYNINIKKNRVVLIIQ